MGLARASSAAPHPRTIMSLLEIFDPKARPRPIGIDLGTTNSLVARVRDGRPHVIADCDQERLVPSAVHYDDRGGVIMQTTADFFRMLPTTEHARRALADELGAGIG